MPWKQLITAYKIYTQVDALFGGKVIVLGGDFRQVLPVVPKGSQVQIVNSCLKKSTLWRHIQVLHLQSNMRVQNCSPGFRELLMQIGNGTCPVVENNLIRIPDQMVVNWEEGEDEETAVQRLINVIYPNLDQNTRQEGFLINRAILASKHEHVHKLNSRIMEAFPGEEVVYYSFDSVIDDVHGLYLIEYLNGLTPTGMAPHELKLKVGYPIMCLRNLDPANGLCNGTQLLCRVFYRNVIDAEIVTGSHRGKRVFIPRIPMMSSRDTQLPFELM
jgi:ATP-dependent DNA helicase PIF1